MVIDNIINFYINLAVLLVRFNKVLSFLLIKLGKEKKRSNNVFNLMVMETFILELNAILSRAASFLRVNRPTLLTDYKLHLLSPLPTDSAGRRQPSTSNRSALHPVGRLLSNPLILSSYFYFDDQKLKFAVV